MVPKANERKANVDFVQTIAPESSSNLKQRDILCVSTLWNVERGEELFVDYGSSKQLGPEHLSRATWALKKSRK